MLIPISHEDQRVSRLPWVTILLVAANVAVFFITLPLVDQQAAQSRQRATDMVRFAVEHPYLTLPEGLAPYVRPVPPPPHKSAETIADEQARLDSLWSDLQALASRSVYRSYGYTPAAPNPVALLTSMFMHAGWLHLLGNMLFLWLAGGSLEDRWGRLFFLILYLVSGLAATLTHAAMHPQSHTPLVGASGAIAGLMGAFLIRLTTTRIRFLYWIFVFRGTFEAPAYVMLPLWVLEQLFMARTGTAGSVAVWAHIGGFGLGVLAALLVRLTSLEERVLAPAIARKITWTASDRLTAAVGKLDRGDPDGAIQDLEAILRAAPEDIEARTSLIDAHTRKGDHAAAGRESARLVNAYLRGRDAAGAMAAAREHKQAFPNVPLAVRDQLALAAHCEKRQEYQEAAVRYQDVLATGPDDPLAPKALMGYGRLLLQVFNEPAAAREILERARRHPRASAEFRQASAELIARAEEALQSRAAPAAATPRAAEAPEPPTHPFPAQAPVPEAAATAVSAATPDRSLAPVPLCAVGLDPCGITLRDSRGKSGHLPWQKVRAICVASIGGPDGAGGPAARLILDLIIGGGDTPGGRIPCIRLSGEGLAIPQLQGEPSPRRAFQRLVATVLKATGAAAHPSREACLGLPAFPAFPDLASYETDLLARLPAHR